MFYYRLVHLLVKGRTQSLRCVQLFDIFWQLLISKPETWQH